MSISLLGTFPNIWLSALSDSEQYLEGFLHFIILISVYIFNVDQKKKSSSTKL